MTKPVVPRRQTHPSRPHRSIPDYSWNIVYQTQYIFRIFYIWSYKGSFLEVFQETCWSGLAAASVNSFRRHLQTLEHVSPLQELHWLRVPERIDFRLAVIVYRCMNGTAPRYLGSELQRVADIESRRRLRSASSLSLHVPWSLHKTIGDCAFPVAAAKVWNMLLPAITSLEAFKRALKTELYRRSYNNAHYRQQ